jgi:hypothetical protein
MRMLILLIALAAGPALAASDDGGLQKFRAEVESACTALAPAEGETAIEVNPSGSENHGAALLITTQADGGVDRYVCIYDKRDGAAELTAPFAPPGELTVPVASTDGNVVPEQTVTTDTHLVKP